MNKPLKQHLIDPEICIRCYTCEMTCPVGAIEHDDNNVVVNPDTCNFCMDCIPVCPTGSIDEWRVVNEPYSLEEQYEFDELPEQGEIAQAAAAPEGTEDGDAEVDPVAALLAEAHAGAGGKAKAPASAAKPSVNLYNLGHPVEAVVQGNYRLTAESSDADVRHIILDFQGKPFPVLEGQSLGIIAPGADAEGKAHLPRLYSVSSPRDGERAGYHNVSLTVKREEGGLCSNYVCDLKKGDKVRVTGPFGATFLMPSDPDARLLMICTGTGSAPMRAFTMARQRSVGVKPGGMMMFFGARTPDSLPYFGPLKKIPSDLLEQHLVFSRMPEQQKEYVQDRMLAEEDRVAEYLNDPKTHIYICGLKGMEEGVERAFTTIAESIGEQWINLRDGMREDGRYHVETY
ncbi:benzoyl-CoA 2,3-epoxidase subunit BoxA [Gymnodinialimonas ceratoperidinii]|uniref:Benzoyl-CoA 2,3-epoxidase subunit BoxA n=1 Tax=Gymnodinialimonas ceratoperidinii TaxID=2856823 RepID=A0A8F6TT27_9RHOB|nr:benzoyl-CoA 2,3-epoxidase subunit BoxA [Gymnodinialimonas ceratoperidinii]QXT38225.1 benzoyl-CoA 2,3-epoxidase subunit BoxA [Gymnodinialimonas ceratoperidinii]